MQPQPSRLSTASPFTTPSTSPGATSLPSDSGWSTGSEWSLSASNPSSRAPSPSQLAARSTPNIRIDLTPEEYHSILLRRNVQTPEGRVTPVPSTSHAMPPPPVGTPPVSRPVSPETPKEKIPRPPNAFMIYRSWLLKNVLKGVEKRQQNVSRVAGECWNLLSDQEKSIWHDKAREAMEEHMRKHPNYKFSPERKSARRKAAQDPDAPAVDSQAYISWLRIQFTGVEGEPVPPSRPRKSRSRRGVGSDSIPAASLPSLHASRSPYPGSLRVASASPSLGASSGLQQAYPHAGPSNVPDFSFPLAHELFTQLEPQMAPSALASTSVSKDDDATPRASTFNDITLPTQSKFNFPTHLPNSSDDGAAHSDLSLAPSFLSSSVQQRGDASRPATPADHAQWEKFIQDPLAPCGTDASDALSHADPNNVYAFDDFPVNLDFLNPIFNPPSE